MKKEKNTHCTPGSGSGFMGHSFHVDREPMNAALCVRAHTVCPEYHCWVLVHVCVCAVGVGGLTGSFAWPLGRRDPPTPPCTGLNYEHKSDKRRRWRAPFLWLLLYIPIFWMCKPVHVVWKIPLLMCIKRMEQRQKMLLFKLLSLLLLLLLLLSSFVKLLIHLAYLSRPFPIFEKGQTSDGEMRFWINYF